jgi:Ankyrin repeats (3 copies)/Ankyrin repeat
MTKAVVWIALLGALVGMGFCVRMLVNQSRFEAAIEAGDEARVRAFLDARPSLVRYEKRGRQSVVIFRPLAAAARAGHPRIVALLLDRGADVNAKSRGEPPLHEALASREIVALLLSRGADVDGRDSQGKTALHYASYDGATTHLLIEKGADVNARDRDGRTPLHDQSKQFTPESAVELCAHGADPSAKDSSGRTPAAMSDPFRAPWLSPEGTCGRLSARFRKDGNVPPAVAKAALNELRCVVLPRQLKTREYPLSHTMMAWSCADLGRAHEEGDGVEKDYPRALELYALACQGEEKWACDRRAVLTAWIAEHKGWLEREGRASTR